MKAAWWLKDNGQVCASCGGTYSFQTYELKIGLRPKVIEELLTFAIRLNRIHMEDIVDDELDLPAKLPSNVKFQGNSKLFSLPI